MIKLGDSFSGKHVLKRKSRMLCGQGESIANGIKVVIISWPLNWESVLNYPGGPSVITRVLNKKWK